MVILGVFHCKKHEKDIYVDSKPVSFFMKQFCNSCEEICMFGKPRHSFDDGVKEFYNKLVVGKKGGKKSDKDKVELRLLFDAPDALEMIARVMMYGKEKYGRKNWMQVEEERYENAELRHYLHNCKGKEWDDGPDGTQQLHLANLACNAIFLLQMKIDELNE